MRMTLGELRCLVHEAAKYDFKAEEAKLKERERSIDALVKRSPVLKKIRLSLAFASASVVRPGKQRDRDGQIVSPGELSAIHAALTTDPEAKERWRVGPLQQDEQGPWFHFANAAELRTHEKKASKEATAGNHAIAMTLDLKVLDVLPKTEFSRSELFKAAKAAGHRMYDTSSSRLIWDAGSPRDASWQATNTYRWARYSASADILGEDALDYETFQPPDFSYVFFPSRPGAGLDVGEKMHFIRDRRKMADADGNIYLVDNIGNTAFSVIRPTLTTKREYLAVVMKALKRRS